MRNFQFKRTAITVLLITALLIPSQNTFAVLGVADVSSNPAMEILQAKTNIILDLMQKLHISMDEYERAERLALKASNLVGKLQTVRKIYLTIESTVCLRKDLNILLTLSGQHNSCIVQYNLSMIDVHATAAVDFIRIALAVGAAMDEGIRSQNVMNAIEALDKSNQQTIRLMANLERIVNRNIQIENVANDVQTINMVKFKKWNF